MENFSMWLFTLLPFLLCKLMERAHWSPQNPFYLFMTFAVWVMAALSIYSLGFSIGSRSKTKREEDIIQLRKDSVDEVRNCYTRFEKEYIPLKEKVALQKFELEKEQWRVKVLREALEEEQTKKKRTPEQANKEAMHSVGGN